MRWVHKALAASVPCYLEPRRTFYLNEVDDQLSSNHKTIGIMMVLEWHQL